ncbi:MAG: LPS assembly lipoprotein LptE [Bacteriovorax sp.]|nr:LPS assembly lipoprotein LptE [Bacteriovorax sp.]
MKVRFFYHSIPLLALILLSNCSGYHFNTNNNPLIGYDIKTISVPMFINRSVLPQLAAPMTREIILALNDYSGLKVVSGDNENADAVLIGILESKDHYNEVVTTTQSLFTEKEIATSIGSRSPFYYPIQTTYNFSLRVILIRRPSASELALLTSDLGAMVKVHPKIVLEDSIDLSGNFARVASPTSATSSMSGEVNFVKNKGIFDKSLQDTCYQAAQTFKQVVLNAF